jgi:cysteine desulfurase/selenocysteine lyase
MNEIPDRQSLAPAVDWAALRARYAVARRSTFLNVGSRGLLSDAVHAAVAARLAAERDMGQGEPAEEVLKAETRARFARLIGAAAAEIAFTRNVSEGLNSIATALPWQAGDNVVFCEELEHANNGYLWQLLARRLGVELRAVPQDRGLIDAGAMAAAIDARTRLVTASSVTFTPGFRTDLATIGAAARAAGALFLVDGVQSLGVLRLDVARDLIDALVASTSKGLNGVRGLGFLYVRQAWIDRLAPVAVARTGIATAGHYSGFEGRDFAFRADAQRFEVGHVNYLGIAAAHAALAETLALGIPAIEARATGMAKLLADGLAAQGWPVNRPPVAAAASHLVTVGSRGNGGPESTGDAKLDAFAAALQAGGVAFTIRRCLLRFGFHLWSDETDVATVLRIGREVLG